MGIYAGIGNDTNTANTTQFSLSQPASALKRLKLKFVEAFSDATADNAYKASIRRTTAAGTSTAFTPTKLDDADGAASAVFGVNHSVEPTYTANSELLLVGGHQRSTFQWWAPPGGEIVVPVTNNAGLGFLTAVVTTAFNLVFTVHWEE